jgi:iron-sulfur cluster insertion protein
MIDFSTSAIAKLQDLLAEENNPSLKLRIFVQGGGCSGFQYGFTFDEQAQEDDHVFDLAPSVGVLVDSMSLQYLQGATVDYVDELMGASFQIKNPNASSSCGCGSSFSV